MARFSEDDLRRFLLGEEIACESSAMTAARYDEDRQELTLKLMGGRPDGYTWPGIDTDMAWDFAEARSKGTWMWANLPIKGVDPRA